MGVLKEGIPSVQAGEPEPESETATEAAQSQKRNARLPPDGWQKIHRVLADFDVIAFNLRHVDCLWDKLSQQHPTHVSTPPHTRDREHVRARGRGIPL